MYLELIPGLIVRVVRSELIWVAGWIELHLCPKYDVLQSNKLFYRVLQACFPPIIWNFLRNDFQHSRTYLSNFFLSQSLALASVCSFLSLINIHHKKMVWRTAGFCPLLIFISFIEIYLLGQTSCRVLSLLTL